MLGKSYAGFKWATSHPSVDPIDDDFDVDIDWDADDSDPGETMVLTAEQMQLIRDEAKAYFEDEYLF